MAEGNEDVMDTGAWGEMPVSTSATTSQEEITTETSCRDAMLQRVAQSNCHFKHQQRDEPDLTVPEKRDIAAAILDKNPITFLERFGVALIECDLGYFEEMQDRYEVKFYLDNIRKNLDLKNSKLKIRNRRYEAMKKLMVETDYFGDEEMKSRNPYLYEQLVGQYLTEDEVKQMSQKNETLSQMFMCHLQGMKNTVLYNCLKDKEDGQMEEDDDDEEEDVEEEEKEETDDKDESGDKDNALSAIEKQHLRTELVRAMQQRFLNGEDDFDYSKVDHNAEYDAIDIQAQDEQDKYFDDEDETYFDDSDDGVEQNRDTGTEEDEYEMYQVEEDVCPGLQQESTAMTCEERDLVKTCEDKLELGE